MYTAIYVSVIIVFCGLSLFLFFFFRNRENKKLEKLRRTDEQKTSVNVESQPKQPNEENLEFATEETLAKDKPTVDAKFEDFVLEMSDEDVGKAQMDGQYDPHSVNLGSDRGRNSLSDKFAEYERFLHERLSKNSRADGLSDPLEHETLHGLDEPKSFADDNLFEDDQDSELEALANFDFDMLRGRSESEIELIISSLPQKAQEILRNDILGRRDVD